MYGAPTVRIVHAADLHVDSALEGLERHDGAPVGTVRGATRRALENLVALCIAEDAKLLLLAGDLFDGAWKDFNTGLFFVSQMKRLREAGIPVVIARGNHDAESRIPKQLRLPGNVRELPTARATTIAFEDLNVAVHGQSYATVAVTEDLAARYPMAVAGTINVGVLHTALDGRPGHDTYAPTTVNKLVDRGYDYWALGHIHTREIVREDPWIVFPGNLQGRHARERGAKGATVIEIEGRRVVSTRHAPLDVVRFEEIRIPIAGDDGGSGDAIDRARHAIGVAHGEAGGRLLAADVVFTGSPERHVALGPNRDRTASDVRSVALDVAGDGVWIARVRRHVTASPTGEEDGARKDALGRLIAAARACGASLDEAAAVLKSVDDLRDRLGESVTAGIFPDAASAEDRADFFAEVEELLRAKLGSSPGSQP